MKESVLISTTEHLLAALYSCGIDNVYVEIDALELPILDGSAKPFIEMLAQAGTRRLRRQRRYIRVVKPLEFSDGDRRIGIYPADEFRVHCFVDYDHPAAGPQEMEMAVDREIFQPRAGPRENFRFVKELRALQRNGPDSRRLARQRHRDGRQLHSERRRCASRTNSAATRRST